MRTILRIALKRWPLLALLISAAMLAVAHAFQAAGYAPCALCLQQREVYWAAIGVGAVGVALQVSRPVIGRWPTKAAIGALALIFLFGAGLAAYHAGVEWDFWPGPPTCSGVSSGPVTLESIEAALSGRTRAVPCDEAAWRLAGVSMAGYNALASLVLAMISALALRRREPALG